MGTGKTEDKLVLAMSVYSEREATKCPMEMIRTKKEKSVRGSDNNNVMATKLKHK